MLDLPCSSTSKFVPHLHVAPRTPSLTTRFALFNSKSRFESAFLRLPARICLHLASRAQSCLISKSRFAVLATGPSSRFLSVSLFHPALRTSLSNWRLALTHIALRTRASCSSPTGVWGSSISRQVVSIRILRSSLHVALRVILSMPHFAHLSLTRVSRSSISSKVAFSAQAYRAKSRLALLSPSRASRFSIQVALRAYQLSSRLVFDFLRHVLNSSCFVVLRVVNSKSPFA